MSFAFATLLLLNQAAASDPTPWGNRSGWIVATIDHSEWCPAGNVNLDIQTGKYSYTAGAPRAVCYDEGLERPVSKGRLRGEKLNRLRAAFAGANELGLEAAACRDGRTPDYTIVVSNGGTPALVLTTGAYTHSAPGELSCWSEAAFKLQRLLDETFNAQRES